MERTTKNPTVPTAGSAPINFPITIIKPACTKTRNAPISIGDNMIAHFEIGILWYLLNTPDSISSTRYIPEAPPLREAETIDTGRMKLTKLLI